jgi:Na+/H+ antiporter NhaD/arsenite permease-like protein
MTAPEAAASLDLTRHWAGYLGLIVFAVTYLTVMAEERLHIRKSQPVIMAAGVIWALIAVAYLRAGDTTTAAEALRHSIAEYGELFLFILVAMTFVNTMEERQVFDALRAWLVRRHLSLRQVFWVTGLMSFFMSSQLDNLTTSLVMGTVAVTVGRGHPRFVVLACINVVVSANAGGAWSAFGDITTLMVWQAGRAEFFDFYRLIVPSLVNWLIPALCMSFSVPDGRPTAGDETVELRRGALGVVGIFAVTIALAVSAYNLLRLPPVIGMTTGLGLLKFYGFYLHWTEPPHTVSVPVAGGSPVRVEVREPASTGASGFAEPFLEPRELVLEGGTDVPDRPRGEGGPLDGFDPPRRDAFDVYEVLRRSEWDTLMFFYGIILCVGGLAQIGYLAQLSGALYGGFGALPANVAIGVISAVVDNIPVMFAVLTMNPPMDLSEWLLVTLTAGVGGSLLSIGSAAGVALMGQARGIYTFGAHLRWTWAIALGYAASIWVHLLINGT